MPGTNATRTAHRTCPLCEATCGLTLTITDNRVTHARGDREHVFSHGFVCPKGAAFPQLLADPDRLRRPLLRIDGTLREVGWDEAFAAVEAGLTAVRANGRDAVAVYLGNPNVHTMAGGLYVGPLVRALGTRNVFSASTVDQMPKHVSSGHLYGDPNAIPVPDLDRTDLLVLLGANPWESNGSLCTAPDFPGRLRALQARGGRFLVVDPRRTRTAAAADEHLPIRPGTDALLLFAVVHTLFDEDLVRLGGLREHVTGLDDVRKLAAAFAPERVTDRCAVPAPRIRQLARELATAPTAAVYGRIGTCTVEFGTLTSWLVDVVNVLTGNLDRPGGAMFPLAAHQRTRAAGPGPGFRTGRWVSRVRGLPEVKGELPVATLADEIETPGEGQVRALITIAGNPVLSTANSRRLDAALASLDFMVSVDPYLNETTRHADVVLPPPGPAHSGHYDFALLTLAVRNVATYSPPVLPPDPDALDECDILARLTLTAAGQGADADPAVLHEQLLARLLTEAAEGLGRSAADLRALIAGERPAERLLDARLRFGAYGDQFGQRPDGLSLIRLLDHPHGVDLGPLRPRLPEVLRTPTGTVELCPPPIAADVARLRAARDVPPEGFVLVGRRHLRSNNSWMHNVPALVKGRDRCTLQVHPDDATTLGLATGDDARVSSRVGSLVVAVEVTADTMPGVVSLPHGWGHDVPGTRQSVARAHAGVNSNVLTDETAVDPLSGNTVLNGIPVRVEPAAPAAPA
ncbi:Anaerobic selenocysteine-containing dehydrogenase [Micromonospora nigra]|uniref:Anaerobic selenocysteine-containing dehydrogenase n=1 Tax=Micromonospora nigra TaxID=145857 RepID=A0A1C6RA59_9ACTN|nr:molybdopterin oxidoreductase family protein [Micromonospora nigra]SCL14015.1 Anaerobic selenocysteine-containing dehydrogenase [Micromonospora nigra]